LKGFKYIVLICLIYVAALYKSNKERKYKIITFLSSMTYPFYILQDFLWEKSKYLNSIVRKIDLNLLRIIAFLLLLFSFSVIATYCFQKPIIKFFNNKDKKL